MPARVLARSRRCAALAVLALAATGCALGERPTLQPATTLAPEVGNEPTGVPEVDALLDRLAAAPNAVYTATYTVTRRLDAVTATATVANTPGTTSITVRDTRYLITSTGTQTCTLSTASCTEGIDAAPLADLFIAPGFSTESVAAQIRVSMSRRNGDPIASTQAIAGQPSECTSISVGAGTETYCVAATGPASLVDRADVRIELTGWSDAADPVLLVPPVR